jgi:hypothetical protein
LTGSFLFPFLSLSVAYAEQQRRIAKGIDKRRDLECEIVDGEWGGEVEESMGIGKRKKERDGR